MALSLDTHGAQSKEDRIWRVKAFKMSLALSVLRLWSILPGAFRSRISQPAQRWETAYRRSSFRINTAS